MTNREATLLASVRAHVLHHMQFYVSLLIGIGTGLVAEALPLPLPIPLLILGAGDAFFAAFLASTAWHARRITPAALRRRASYEDDGIILIVAVTLAAIALCIGAIFSVLAQSSTGRGPLAFALMSVPLCWATLHTVVALRYAHVFYAEAEDGSGGRGDAGGLAFPNCILPGISDFLYHAFVVGMTAQVSDVQVVSTRMRRLTLLHGVAAFFFNAIILALAVNAAYNSLH